MGSQGISCAFVARTDGSRSFTGDGGRLVTTQNGRNGRGLLARGIKRRRTRERSGVTLHLDPLLKLVFEFEFVFELVQREKQEFADEGQVGSAAWRDTILRDGLIELAEGEIDIRGGHEPPRESGGELGAESVGFDNLALGAGVEDTKRRMIGLAEHATGAAIGERELTKSGFVGGDTGTGAFWLIHSVFP